MARNPRAELTFGACDAAHNAPNTTKSHNQAHILTRVASSKPKNVEEVAS